MVVTKALIRPEEDKSALAEKYQLELVTELDAILNDPEIAIVVEVMGMDRTSQDFIKKHLWLVKCCHSE